MWQQHKVWSISPTPTTADTWHSLWLREWLIDANRKRQGFSLRGKKKKTWKILYLVVFHQPTIFDECPWQINTVLCQTEKKFFEFHLVTDLKHNLHPIYSLSSGIFLACLRLLLVLGASCFPFLLLLRTIMREMTHFDQPWYSQKISQGSFCSFATGTINCEMAMSLISKRWSNEKNNLSIFSRVVLALHHNRKINWT